MYCLSVICTYILNVYFYTSSILNWPCGSKSEWTECRVFLLPLSLKFPLWAEKSPNVWTLWPWGFTRTHSHSNSREHVHTQTHTANGLGNYTMPELSSVIVMICGGITVWLPPSDQMPPCTHLSLYPATEGQMGWTCVVLVCVWLHRCVYSTM